MTSRKLWVLAEFRLAAVASLGVGLVGGGTIELERLLDMLDSVFVLETCIREEALSRAFSSDTALLALTFTRPRFEIGSNDITRGLGTEMFPTSIESWKVTRRETETVGAILAGRVNVAEMK